MKNYVVKNSSDLYFSRFTHYSGYEFGDPAQPDGVFYGHINDARWFTLKEAQETVQLIRRELDSECTIYQLRPMKEVKEYIIELDTRKSHGRVHYFINFYSLAEVSIMSYKGQWIASDGGNKK